jgi:hypothetical protein
MASVTLFALPMAAQANLPATRTDLIVPPTSIGGVSLGESYSAAHARWGRAAGSGSQCQRGDTCTYNTTTDGNAGFICKHGHVVEIFINVWEDAHDTKLNFHSPLTRLKTATGIHIGSTLDDLTLAYPDGEMGGGGFGGPYFKVTGLDGMVAYFEFSDSGRVNGRSRVVDIELDKGHGGA